MIILFLIMRSKIIQPFSALKQMQHYLQSTTNPRIIVHNTQNMTRSLVKDPKIQHKDGNITAIINRNQYKLLIHRDTLVGFDYQLMWCNAEQGISQYYIFPTQYEIIRVFENSSLQYHGDSVISIDLDGFEVDTGLKTVYHEWLDLNHQSYVMSSKTANIKFCIEELIDPVCSDTTNSRYLDHHPYPHPMVI